MLLHPTSLPAGTIGADARRFVDFLADAGFSVWQVLPLGPVDENGSPYRLRSAFAGGIDLIDPDDLRGAPWWPRNETPDGDLVAQAYALFRAHADRERKTAFARFRSESAGWLMPWALFSLLHARFDGRAWWDWPVELRDHRPADVAALVGEHMPELGRVMFGQFLFDGQWRALRDYARRKGVFLFGDLPFYVDPDSADVWWHRHLFQLDETGLPAVVAGVPPDYFSAEGQRWGSPLYDWDALRAEGFEWWFARLAHQARWLDLLRLDHFRALEQCWAIPATAASPREGHWQNVPGAELLERIYARLTGLTLVAEDLGTITPDVIRLRERFGMPGMRVLQFAFDGSSDNPHLPENHEANAVVYTGTHDNDTSAGWYAGLDADARAYVDSIIGHPASPAQAADVLIGLAYASVARLAVIPLQDLLRLGSDARMNTPGRSDGNWDWTFSWSQLTPQIANRCRILAAGHGRGAEASVSDVRKALV